MCQYPRRTRVGMRVVRIRIVNVKMVGPANGGGGNGHSNSRPHQHPSPLGIDIRIHPTIPVSTSTAHRGAEKSGAHNVGSTEIIVDKEQRKPGWCG
jgi:hypothetical protein